MDERFFSGMDGFGLRGFGSPGWAGRSGLMRMEAISGRVAGRQPADQCHYGKAMSTLDSRPATSDEDPRYRFVYDEAVRTLDHQEETLDGLRARAGVLLTATSVATSFLGAAALRDTRNNGPWPALAVFLFVVVGLLCVALLLPRGNWRWRFGATELLRDYVEASPPADMNEMFKDLALHLEGNYAHNKQLMEPMWMMFRAATGLLALEVLFWLAALL